MTSLVLREFNGVEIRQRADGYVCLTDMAKASGKLFSNWFRLKSTQEFLSTLAEITGFSITKPESTDTIGCSYVGIQLIEITKGSFTEDQNSYGHPKVAIAFAMWCDSKFFCLVIDWTEEILVTGKVPAKKKALPEKTREQLSEDMQREMKDAEEMFNRLFSDANKPFRI